MSCCEIFIFNFFPIPLFSMMKIVAGKLSINGPQAFLKLTSKGERERGWWEYSAVMLTGQTTFPFKGGWKRKGTLQFSFSNEPEGHGP